MCYTQENVYHEICIRIFLFERRQMHSCGKKSPIINREYCQKPLDYGYNSRRIGADHESIAVRYLKENGYTILKRNYRVRCGEIDIIAQRDGYIVFIEVKYRSNTHTGTPGESVDHRKQRQISKVAMYYLNQYGYGIDTAVRFDVITMTGDKIVHIENAYDYAGW